MKKSKPWYKKCWIWAVFIITIGAVISIPFIINYSYMEGLKLTEPNTAFTASDLLMLYGSVLGGVFTIFALVVTIRFTAYQSIQEQKKQRKLLIADFNKAEIVRKSNETIEYADKLKRLFLLEMINDNGGIIERTFSINCTANFFSAFVEAQYWISKLYLSDGEVEARFFAEFSEFEEHTKEAVASVKKELEASNNYKKEYDNRKQEFENRKFAFLRENPTYKFQLSMQKDEKPQPPPYGTFDMEEPESEKEIFARLVSKLKAYRDEHKERFTFAYDSLLEHYRLILAQEIAKLYDFKENTTNDNT